MKIINNIYKNVEKGFEVVVTTCNSKIATTKDLATGEIVKFNRSKLEWMINKGVFAFVGEAE